MNSIEFKGVKTRIITSKDRLADILEEYLKKSPMKDGDILAISSKVVALTEGRKKKVKNEYEFQKYLHDEADCIIGNNGVVLALKNGIFAPWAGIDRSNVREGEIILWPKDPFRSAKNILEKLKNTYKLKDIGVIITDSFCLPLRQGVSGVTIGYAGFQGVNDLRGNKDLFGNTLKITKQNIVDMLAAGANLVMGESNDAYPFVIIRGAQVKFVEKISVNETIMVGNECLYSSLYPKKLTLKKKTSK